MNLLLKSRTLIFIFALIALVAKADDQQELPTSSWEQHPDGLSVALEFVNWLEGGHQKHEQIRVHIKNTSSSTKYFLFVASDRGIEIYYVNNQGKLIPLRDYSRKQNDVVLANVPPFPIEPGHTIVESVELSASDLAIVKHHAIACRFYISNQWSGGFLPIDSSPRQLTETNAQ